MPMYLVLSASHVALLTEVQYRNTLNMVRFAATTRSLVLVQYLGSFAPSSNSTHQSMVQDPSEGAPSTNSNMKVGRNITCILDGQRQD